MENVLSVEFALSAVFHQRLYSDEVTVFSLRTIKGRTLWFSSKKSSALSFSSLSVTFI